MAQLRDHQQQLKAIQTSLDAVVAALEVNPALATAYKAALENRDDAEADQAAQAALHRLGDAIARLEKE